MGQETDLKAKQAEDVVGHDMLLLVAQDAGLHEGINVHIWHDAQLPLFVPQLLYLICTSWHLAS